MTMCIQLYAIYIIAARRSQLAKSDGGVLLMKRNFPSTRQFRRGLRHDNAVVAVLEWIFLG